MIFLSNNALGVFIYIYLYIYISCITLRKDPDAYMVPL